VNVKLGDPVSEKKSASFSSGGRTFCKYKEELSSAEARIREGSKRVKTSHGLIEYSTIGAGPPVMYIHGAGGGHDMGRFCAGLIGSDFKWICPSRFGYLRTPLTADASCESQADAFASLLDHLDIEKAAVVGLSAGGPSALLFALRHPQRCNALVLQSAITKTFRKRPFSDHFFNLLFRSDFFFWVLSRIGRNVLLRNFGSNPGDLKRMDPHDSRIVEDVLNILHPASRKLPGIVNDQKASLSNRQYALDQINAPTLILHALKDRLVDFEFAAYAHERIPDSELIPFENGGHIFIALDRRFKERITRFLVEHA
jgi:pimeloyl-ACP methyl ester carboxylesterase